MLEDRPAGTRQIVAVAGAPGAGKSTFAKALVSRVNISCPDRAALVEMDGFHYDNSVLQDMRRLEHKGAADTFDVDGLAHTLTRLRENTSDTVAVPVFDRSIETARAGARLIRKQSDIIVVEGNYLLLDIPPWNRLAVFFDITVMIAVDIETLNDRLFRRWRKLGFSAQTIQQKVQQNDLPNGRMVIENSISAQFIVDGS